MIKILYITFIMILIVCTQSLAEQGNIMSSANGPTLNYLKSISQQYGDIITRCENKEISSNPDYFGVIAREVGIIEKLEQSRRGPDLEELKQMVACAVGFSLRDHDIHSAGGDKVNDTIKLYQKLLEDEPRRESCALALQQLKNARTTFEAYYADNNSYPATIKASGFKTSEGVSLKGEVLKPQIHELSSTHDRCNVTYYSGSKAREIREKVKKGFPQSLLFAKTDTELLVMLRELGEKNNYLHDLPSSVVGQAPVLSPEENTLTKKPKKMKKAKKAVKKEENL